MRTAVRLLILCLFIRFPYAFCAEVEDDYNGPRKSDSKYAINET